MPLRMIIVAVVVIGFARPGLAMDENETIGNWRKASPGARVLAAEGWAAALRENEPKTTASGLVACLNDTASRAGTEKLTLQHAVVMCAIYMNR
jgi:hypothetical protein